MKIFDKRIFLFSNEIFWYRETKTSTENRDTPPPPPIQIFSVPEISETLKGSPTEFFGTVRRKIFKVSTENLDTPPPLIQTFSIHEVNETLKDPPYGNFRHCETKNFPKKILKLPPPPPPLIHKIFRYRKFSETQHRRDHLPNFSAL